MKIKQKKIKRIVACLLAAICLIGLVIFPFDAANAAEQSEGEVIIVTPDETGQTDAENVEATEELEELEQTEQIEEMDSSEGTDSDGTVDEEELEETEKPEEPKKEAKPIKLSKPDSFEVTAVKDGIQMSWKKVSKAQKYEIYRKTADEDSFTQIKVTKKLTYKDKTAAYGVTYVYRVRAIAVSAKKTYKSVYSQKKKCCTYRIDPSKPMVALTFDDGPSQYTTGILDALEKYKSRATFFQVGYRVNQYRDIVLRIDQLGCEIGNHSYDHALLGSASASKIRKEISVTDARIKAITGKKTVLLRPPYGSIGSSLKQNAGKPMILWSIDTLDWKSQNADKVYQHVMKNVSDGDIILMHDLYSSSRYAAKRIIQELKKRGYQLVTVSELAQYRKVKLLAGERYSQMRP